MATAHLMYGFLGAGKTTLAKRLERGSHAVRYSPDEWMTRLHGDDPPADRFAIYAERIQSLIDEQWPRVLAAGVDVVLDFGFWSRRSRDEARARVSSCGAESRLYWVACDRAIALARCRARNQQLHGSLYISDTTFELLEQRFEPLQADEARVASDGLDELPGPAGHGSG
jgi:predicted kinase